MWRLQFVKTIFVCLLKKNIKKGHFTKIEEIFTDRPDRPNNPNSLLICTLISDLRNQGLLQTLEKFQVLETWVCSINPAFFQGGDPEKNTGFQNLICFF
jgi:hypothetical protein